MAATKRSSKTAKSPVKATSRTIKDLKAKAGKASAVKGGVPRY